jgi:hypothetical protein
VIEDPHASLRELVLQNVLEGPGETNPTLRKSVAEATFVPKALKALVDKIHRHAYKVTDEDISKPQAKYGDDQMFEIVVSASLGASQIRLMAGLAALDEA